MTELTEDLAWRLAQASYAADRNPSPAPEILMTPSMLVAFARLAASHAAPAADLRAAIPVTPDLHLIWNTLQFFAHPDSYTLGERTGGVLQGCPRKPPPTPDEMAGYARRALESLFKAVGKEPDAWMAGGDPAPGCWHVVAPDGRVWRNERLLAAVSAAIEQTQLQFPARHAAAQLAAPTADLRAADEQTYTGSLRDPDTWATYIAGIIDSYLSSENAVRERDVREAALAGIIRRRIGWLTAPEHVPDPGCKSCSGTGSVCVGHSGREDDGDAPIIEQCDCFWPVSEEGVKKALCEVARLEGELRAMSDSSHAAAQLAAVAAPPEGHDEFTEGVNAAAAMLDKMADDFAYEHSVVDWETGAREFGGRGSSSREDYYNTLRELADDIRSIVHGNEERAVAAVAAPDAREAGGETLAEAAQAYRDAQDALDNREYAGINAEPSDVLVRRRNAARDDLDAALAHPAAPGSLDASRAPLSEPCALDQGARPVRPLTDEQIVAIVREASRNAAIRRDGTTSIRIVRAVEAAHGIAPPVDQQEGSTQ